MGKTEYRQDIPHKISEPQQYSVDSCGSLRILDGFFFQKVPVKGCSKTILGGYDGHKITSGLHSHQLKTENKRCSF